MLTRRTALALAAAALATPTLSQERANPMPDALREALERDRFAPVLGNPKGDITLTEFFDYNCPHCRKMVPTLQRLIAADPDLRVTFREWPVFGTGSWFAAKASLAALKQGRYWPMHSGLMAMKDRAEEASVLRVARAAGLDLDRMRKDMEGDDVAAHIDRSMELADHMGLAGTPTFIAGDEALFGSVPLAELKRLVADGRRALAA